MADATAKQIRYLTELAADLGKDREAVRAWAERAGRYAVSQQIANLLRQKRGTEQGAAASK